VRVNRLDGELAADDLALVAGLPIDGLVVPQAVEDSIDLALAPGLPVMAVIENARGLRAAYEIASRPFVHAFQLGAKDLALDLGHEPRDDALELLYTRSKLVVDAVAAGLTGIFDRVYFSDDPERIEADAAFARSLGFRGKSTVAAADTAIINRVFAR
jgi:citrate lyase subunit beta/citryl-CoA lyase